MEEKKRGLGRGLSALIGDTVAQEPAQASGPGGGQAPAEDSVKAAGQQLLGIDQLRPGAFQPRKSFNADELSALAASIEKSGVLQPLLVRRVADNKADAAYEIIAGERRWRAAQQAKLHEVPVIVQDINDVTALEIGIIENVQRADLNPIEEAEGYQRLISEFAYTQAELAETIGKSRSHIANLLRLVEAPDAVRRALIDGAISMGHARALLGIDNAAALVKQIIAEGLSVRAVEKLAAADKTQDKTQGKTQSGEGQKAGGKANEKSADTRALEKTLTDGLGVVAQIEARGEAGELRLSYRSLEQLDDLVARLLSGRAT